MSSTAQTAEGEKILIVDDDPGLSSLLERFFTSKGYRARAVANTEQMDRLLSREVFNLVVLDLMLPGEDGLTACRRLRAANNQVPIIMLTATRELKRGEEVHMLTTGEFAVLKALVMHAREPLTRDKLMNLARGREWDALERSIDVQISRLRRMIEPDPSKPRYIQTVWGVGYVFVPDGAATK